MNNKQKITKKQLRTFGAALTIFLSVIGLIHFWKGNEPTNFWFWGAAALVLLTTLSVPILINPIYRAAMFIAHILGWINTRIILGLLYYFLFTPIALVMKLIGHDPLHRKFDKEAKSYWKVREKIPFPKEHYLRQF
ncbi:MAG: SxtJ family membrane protein [bacterium]|nr:SxtJ family membrane protein [bacterium]